jgi:hypothetical protein
MGLNTAQLQPHYDGDIRQAHLFPEAQEKYGALLSGQSVGRCPYRLEFLLRQQNSLWRAARITDLKRRHFLRMGIIEPNQTLPEVATPATLVIARKVNRNPQQPGINPTLTPKTFTFTVGSPETFLCEGVGGIGISQQYEKYAVHAPLVPPHNLVELFGFDSLKHACRCHLNR